MNSAKLLALAFFIVFTLSIPAQEGPELPSTEQLLVDRRAEAEMDMAQQILAGASRHGFGRRLDPFSLGALDTEQLRQLLALRQNDPFPWSPRDIELMGLFLQQDSTAAPPLGPEVLVGLWENQPITAAGWSHVFLFYPDGRFAFHYSQMRELPLIESFQGQYRIEGQTLVLNLETRRLWQTNGEIEVTGYAGRQWQEPTLVNVPDSRVLRLPLGNLTSFASLLSEEQRQLSPHMSEMPTCRIGGITFFRKHQNPNEYFR